MSGENAVTRLWELPELVIRNLLPYLDAHSIASLASVHEPAIQVLHEDWGHSLMKQRIKENGLPCNNLNEKTLEQNRIGLRCLAKLLLKMKNPMELQLALLEMICEKCPPRSLKKCVQLSCPTPGQCVTCLNETPHLVSVLGFSTVFVVWLTFDGFNNVHKLILISIVGGNN